MKRFYVVMLLAIFSLVLGCGGDAVPEPPVMDAQMLEQIRQEDERVADAERNQ